MEEISQEEIRHIARLAKLRFADEEIDAFAAQFNRIVAYVEKLNEVDTEGVEPMARLLRGATELRADEPGPMLAPAEALKNAPRKTEGFFSVPRVLGEDVE